MKLPASTTICGLALVGLVLLAGGLPQAGADEVLFDFGQGFDISKAVTYDTRVSVSKAAGGAAIAVATGHKEQWPSITLKAPKGTWDLSKFEFVEMAVRNTGSAPVTVNCRVDNEGADGTRNCCTDRVAVKPGESATLRVQLARKPAGHEGIKLFGMRGYPVPTDATNGINPAKVTQLMVFVAKPRVDHAFEIGNIRAGGSYAGPKETPVTAEKFFPFIDQFGQYIHRDWPGKTHAATDLDDQMKEEAASLKSRPGPKNWDQYGGWKAGPQLEATGFFRAEKRGGKWWLVDPEGRLFWSHGIDCVGEHGDTPIEDRDNWFADLPAGQPDFKEFFGSGHAIHGYYKGRTMRTFDFIGANLNRKYGPKWKTLAAEAAHKRLRSWGMNTIANWSDADIYLMRRTPYTATVHFSSRPIQGSQGYWGQFKDPFEPEFARKVKEALAGHAGKAAGDPWCIGFFVDNEIAWGDDTSLAVAALQSPPDQAAKKALLEDLKAKYGEIGKLNEAWGTSHASWDALAQSTAAPDKNRAAGDLGEFYTRLAEQYFRVIRDAVNEVAPRQLYLGCRFAWVNDRAVAAAVKSCDVVSYNFYRRSVADVRLPGGADKPIIVGEFHFGALDRGMFHTGLVPCTSQAERAAAYKSYVRGALANPQIVGTHWFKYQDEPTTGRPLDAENYQIGFVDVCDT
ncbi:MAG: beta-agarase, partial [Planctomycetota bacterium]|nr:beta-agarase [Planctomycetota bacterium]